MPIGYSNSETKFRHYILTMIAVSAIITGSQAWVLRTSEGVPGVQCLHMCEVFLATCILLRYTKIAAYFSSRAEMPHCCWDIMHPMRHIWEVFKL